MEEGLSDPAQAYSSFEKAADLNPLSDRPLSDPVSEARRLNPQGDEIAELEARLGE